MMSGSACVRTGVGTALWSPFPMEMVAASLASSNPRTRDTAERPTLSLVAGSTQGSDRESRALSLSDAPEAAPQHIPVIAATIMGIDSFIGKAEGTACRP